jgi:hypothetical protein
MTIEVQQISEHTFEISWDENDPQESVFNHFTEQDFLNIITEYINKFNETDRESKDLL